MSLPSVTLIVCAYNQQAYVREAVNGALSQDYSPLEIVLSDDCSSDASFDIMREMASDYRGPHVIRLNRNPVNLGLGRHLQKIFEMSNGEWIVTAAGDDISLSNRCSTLVRAAIAGGSDTRGVASSWVDIDESGNYLHQPSAPTIWHRRQTSKPWPKGIEAVYEALVHGQYILPGCAAMWHHSLITGWPAFSDGLVYEDVTLSCRAHLTGKLLILNESLLKYRQHEGAVVNLSEERFSPSQRIALNRKKKKQNYLRLRCYQQAFADIENLVRNREISLTPDEISFLEKMRDKEALDSAIYRWWEMPVITRLRNYLSRNFYPFEKRGLRDIFNILPWEWREYCRPFVKRN